MFRVQRGDDTAFGLLMQRHHARLLNLAWRYFGDRAAAEDAVQETFLKVYQARERWRPDAPLQAYLLRVASNVCLSVLRRHKPLSLDEGPDGAEETRGRTDPHAVQPDQASEQSELHRRVREAVAALPDRQRMAIVLNKFEGLDYEQVAEHLGLTVPATKSLLHRARMVLKDVLERYL
jgi:RNA polymerase sigma-70 factor (ECF subfamily)